MPVRHGCAAAVPTQGTATEACPLSRGSGFIDEHQPFEDLLDSIPPIGGKTGRGRRRPDKLHADKAYDHRRCRQACRRRGIAARIARRRIETSQKLGRHRWVVERTFAWINRYRRLITRYERRSDIHHALAALACSLICFSKLQGGF